MEEEERLQLPLLPKRRLLLRGEEDVVPLLPILPIRLSRTTITTHYTIIHTIRFRSSSASASSSLESNTAPGISAALTVAE